MFFFNRDNIEEPAFFVNAWVNGIKRKTERYYHLPIEERLQTDLGVSWRRSIPPPVLDALKLASCDKCAFCESKIDELTPYRFRPPANATNRKGKEYKDENWEREDKLCYNWLIWEWENFFPICDDCIPTEKNFFPVKGKRAVLKLNNKLNYAESIAKYVRECKENSTLLYPGEINSINSYFNINLKGQLIFKNNRARTTLDNYQLNRAGLVKRRNRTFAVRFKRYINLSIKLCSETRSEQDLYNFKKEGFYNFKELEYGGSWYLMFKLLSEYVKQPNWHNGSLAIEKIEATHKKWREEPDYEITVNSFLSGYKELINKSISDISNSTIAGQSKYKFDTPTLKSLKIENYKSIESLDIEIPEIEYDYSDAYSDRNTPCLLILGENAVGKSSILEAISLSCMSQESIDTLDLKAEKLTLNPTYLGSNYKKRISKSTITANYSDGESATVTISSKGDSITRSALTKKEPLIFAYGAHRYFGDPRENDSISNVITLFKSDVVTPNPEAWLLEESKKDPMTLDEVASALRHIISIDGGFEKIFIPRDKESVFISLKKTNRKNEIYTTPMEISVVSSGYRAIIALVCDVFNGIMTKLECTAHQARHVYAIVLVDEIEAHLHPRWKMRIISGLRKALPNITFIFTTHDPLCTRGMKQGETLVVNRISTDESDNRSSYSEYVEIATDVPDPERMTIEQILTSDLFQMYSTDDQDTERKLSRVSDLLLQENITQSTDRNDGEKVFSEDSRNELLSARSKIADEIKSVLPIGGTEIQRLVQDAVEQYLIERQKSSTHEQSEAREKAKAVIVSALKDMYS